jgi:hypothetical protein
MAYDFFWETPVAAFFEWCDDKRTINARYCAVKKKRSWSVSKKPVPDSKTDVDRFEARVSNNKRWKGGAER